MMGWWETLLAASDLNRDNKVTLDEVLLVVDRLPELLDEIFHRLDLNGDGHLSREEFIAFWVEFWVGDDPTSPGTWVFGRFDPTQPPTP